MKWTAYPDHRDVSENPKCYCCGKQGGQTKAATIVHRWDWELTISRFTVCAEGPCGGHLQMAYEG